ncbi:MAG: transcription elongation factor GreA [Aeriscardovia sp.]|nr:transcription elongation factor GreA [Aeriscardovia sp.]
MAIDENTVILLTKDAYNTMKKELDERQGPIREDIIQKIATARAEGDLSENGGYQAAKDAQAKNEGRINELIIKLRAAKILTPPPAGEVGVGSIVTLNFAGMKNEYLIGPHELSIATDKQIISPESPVGAAVMGHHKGDSVSYQTPNGHSMTVIIDDSVPIE